MDYHSKLKRLEEKAATAKSKRDGIAGALKVVRGDLKAEGVKGPKHAGTLINTLDCEISDKEAELEGLLAELEGELTS